MAQQHLSGNLRLRQAWPKIEANTTELYERTEPASEEKAGLMSAEDKAKLDGIEDGAQINQNAFAKVNDLEASDPSDTFAITGGTGITTTTNPNTNEVIITATGEATPGPHGSSHTEFGSDPIPYATTTDGGLMSAEDKQSLEALEGLPQEVTELKAETIPYLDNGKIHLPSTFPSLPFNIYKRKYGEFYSDATPYNQFDWSDATNIYIRNPGVGSTGTTPNSPISLAQFKTNFGNGEYGASKKFILNFLDYIYYLTATGNGSIEIDMDADLLIRSASPSGMTWLGRLKHNGINGYTSSWTSDSDVYKTTQSTNHNVIDVVNLAVFDDFKMPSVYRKVESLAACQSQKGSFYQSDAVVYCNPIDGHDPEDLILVVSTAVVTFNQPNARTTMYENIGFLPSAYRTGSGGHLDTTVYAFGCKFHRALDNGFFMSGKYKAYVFNCVSSHPSRDCFNFHTTDVNSVAVEVNNTGYGAGRYKILAGDTTSNNGSSAHDGMHIIRVGCNYFDCEGNIVVDIDDCYSINIGIEASSILDTKTGGNCGAFRFTGDTKPKFVIECSGYGRNVDYGIQGTATTYIANFTGLQKYEGDVKGRDDMPW